eukprot:257478-Pyramimonas_sp.AAC.1
MGPPPAAKGGVSGHTCIPILGMTSEVGKAAILTRICDIIALVCVGSASSLPASGSASERTSNGASLARRHVLSRCPSPADVFCHTFRRSTDSLPVTVPTQVAFRVVSTPCQPRRSLRFPRPTSKADELCHNSSFFFDFTTAPVIFHNPPPPQRGRFDYPL